MIQLGTVVKIADKSGAVLGTCIRVLNVSYKKKIAKMGDVVLIVVKWISQQRFRFMKERLKKKYCVGTMHRAMVVRAKMNYKVNEGVFIRFDENAVVLVTRKRTPIANRIYGPILRKFCLKYTGLGCIARTLI